MSQSSLKNFFWGASTSSHQVEGGNNNQWTQWELHNSKRLARGSKRKLSKFKNWEDIKDRAQNPENYISGKGVDHYNLYKKDFDIAKQLNINCLRFSIEWSRIEPKQGEWDQKEIEHYLDYIVEMKERGITPFLNIWHWTVPIWFSELGGFEKKQNIKYFDRFVKKIAHELINDIDYVLILNETNVYTTYSYLTKQWPPAGRSLLKAIKVNLNLVRAHKIAYSDLKQVKPSIQVGIAHNMSLNLTTRMSNPISEITAKIADKFWNWWFLDKVTTEIDFVGINYYQTQYVSSFKMSDPIEPVNDLGWYMNPSGIYDLSKKVWDRYAKPIIISENGVADEKDIFRKWWIEETVKSIRRLKEEDVEIFGYFHWSLLDNFEWAYGWWPKFGLISVDRSDMSRNVRKSAYTYSDIIKSETSK